MSTPKQPYTVEWHSSDKKICVITVLEDNWDWEIAVEAIQKQVELCETVEHPVHVVFHFKVRSNIPRQGAFQNLPRLMKYRAPNEDLGIFVGFNAMLSMLLQTAGKIYGLRELVAKYRFVDTMQEALAEIERYEAAQST